MYKGGVVCAGMCPEVLVWCEVGRGAPSGLLYPRPGYSNRDLLKAESVCRIKPRPVRVKIVQYPCEECPLGASTW